jgi:hypothetical protein
MPESTSEPKQMISPTHVIEPKYNINPASKSETINLRKPMQINEPRC